MFSMSNVTIHSKEIILIKPSISSFAAEEPDNSNDRKRENILVFVGKWKRFQGKSDFCFVRKLYLVSAFIISLSYRARLLQSPS